MKHRANVFMGISIVLLAGHWSVQTVSAGNLNLNGQWIYSDSSQPDSDDFRQNYNVSYSGKTSLTDTIFLNGNLRYSKNIREDYDSDFISPALTLTNTNDIYRFSLYGNYTYRTDSNDKDSEGWNWAGNLGSSWTNRLIPSLAMSFGQKGSRVNGETASRSDFATGRTGWAYWDWLGLYYSIDWSRNNAVQANDLASEDLTQRVGLDASERFFANRLLLGLNLNYSHNRVSYDGQTGDGGFALLPAIVNQALYEKTTDPATGTLTQDASFLVSDEEPSQTLTINPADDPLNLGINVDFQQTDVIYLTIQNDIEAFADNFSWDLYSSDNGEDWILEQASVPFVYDPDEQRFEFEFSSLKERWIKIVANTSSLLPLQLTEVVAIEAFRKIFGDGDGSTISEDITREVYQARFNLGYRLMQNMRFSYNFSYDRQEYSQENENRERITNNASLGWSPSRYFSARLNASESREIPEESPELTYRRYGLSMGSSPLDTLEFSLGGSLYENYEDDELDDRYAIYSLNTTAQLYPDLLASLDLTYTDILDGDRNDAFGERLLLTARLRPTLIFTLDQRFDRNLDSGTDSHENIVTLNWRISEILYVNNSLTLTWSDDTDTAAAYRLVMGVAPNHKNRITLSYVYLHEEEDSNLFSGSWSWLINPVFSFTLSGNYQISEEAEDQWRFQGNLRYFYSAGN